MDSTSSRMKIAPNSKESEMMVLGCMLTNMNGLNVGSDALDDSDFYYSEHQVIFKVLKNAYKQDKPADVHLVCEELKRMENLERVGGMSYVMTLAQYAGTSAYIEEYTEIIKSKSILRKMIDAAQVIEKKALDEPADVSSTLDDSQALLFSISQQSNRESGILLSDILTGCVSDSKNSYLKDLQDRRDAFLDGGVCVKTGLPSGFEDLDNLINGLSPSNLIIIAGRPGMGKTALAVNMAEYVCFNHNLPVGIFSLEMSYQQLANRIVCSQAEVESSKITGGTLSSDEHEKVKDTIKRLKEKTLIIDDTPGLRINDLRARARQMKERHNIALLIVDYLQLLSGSSNRFSHENRQQEISEISRMLKTLSRELNIPILCGSQLSRKVEDRTGHRPMMSDLRESGSIEQDADIVLFMLRREYYDPYEKPGQCEIIIGKNRHGKVGSVILTFMEDYVKFANFHDF